MALRPRRRILHTSDVHLGAYDSKSGPPPRRAELEDGFRRVIDVAIEEGVDLLMIAGDFFDNGRVYQETLEFAADEIARFGGATIIAPGNHDHVGPNSLYDRIDFIGRAPNLTILRDPKGEWAAYDDLEIEVWGKAHTETDSSFAPFTNTPPRGDAAWQIGIGHGHFIHPLALRHGSFHILADELEATQRDYIGLGHWERLTRVDAGQHVTAAYSGAPDALSGMHGGHVLMVELEEDGTVRLHGVPLGDGPRIPHDDLPHLPRA